MPPSKAFGVLLLLCLLANAFRGGSRAGAGDGAFWAPLHALLCPAAEPWNPVQKPQPPHIDTQRSPEFRAQVAGCWPKRRRLRAATPPTGRQVWCVRRGARLRRFVLNPSRGACRALLGIVCLFLCSSLCCAGWRWRQQPGARGTHRRILCSSGGGRRRRRCCGPCREPRGCPRQRRHHRRQQPCGARQRLCSQGVFGDNRCAGGGLHVRRGGTREGHCGGSSSSRWRCCLAWCKGAGDTSAPHLGPCSPTGSPAPTPQNPTTACPGSAKHPHRPPQAASWRWDHVGRRRRCRCQRRRRRRWQSVWRRCSELCAAAVCWRAQHRVIDAAAPAGPLSLLLPQLANAGCSPTHMRWSTPRRQDAAVVLLVRPHPASPAAPGGPRRHSLGISKEASPRAARVPGDTF